MKLSGVDANLLVAFDALLRERNVTRAAKRLGIGQPAMSHALARLRGHFGDPLLTRVGRELTLTPRALELADSVARAVASFSDVFSPREPRDPRTGRALVLACSDVFASRFAPALVRALHEDVPSVTVEARALAARSTERILAEGTCLAFGVFEDVPAHINQQLLFSEPFVCLVRANHPKVRKHLPLDLYLELPHLEVFPAPHSRPGERVTRALAADGKRRRVTARVAHYLAAARVLEQSDHVLTMTRGNAGELVRSAALRVLPAPFEVAPLRFSQIWRRQYDDDVVHRWFRETAARVCIAIGRGRKP